MLQSFDPELTLPYVPDGQRSNSHTQIGGSDSKVSSGSVGFCVSLGSGEFYFPLFPSLPSLVQLI